jgi:hypothetical protein
LRSPVDPRNPDLSRTVHQSSRIAAVQSFSCPRRIR